MAAKINMYRMKRIITNDFPVDLPKCMYPMKNIHTRRNGTIDGSNDHVPSSEEKLGIFEQNNQKIPGMAELEAKQAEILKQLAELKNQILSIKSDLKISHSASSVRIVSQTSTNKVQCTTNNLANLIINASPTNPPYSLELLQKLFKNVVNLKFTIHLHSSVTAMTDGAKELQRRLLDFKCDTDAPSVNVTLIWKNVGPNMELIIGYVPVQGEVNVLRYLSRAVNSPLSCDSMPKSVEVDSLLDACYLILRAKTKVERAALYQSLNKSLGKSSWLAGRNEIGLADVAAFSCIKQVCGVGDISANLRKWYQRCETLA